MPELSEERVRWLRNRCVEMVQRSEEMSEELARVLRLFAEHKNEDNPVQPGAEPPS